MSSITLPQPFRKLLVVGSIYDKMDKLSRVEQMIPNYDWIIFNGGLCFPFDLASVKNRIEQMKQLMTTGKVIYVAGRLDYLVKTETIMRWIISLPNVVIANFPTRSAVIMDGGISPNIKKRQNLDNNIEISFVSHIENKPWHQLYNGSLGYIISNNPLTDEKPQHYRYSMRLGNRYDGEVYAQEIDEMGLKQTILL